MKKVLLIYEDYAESAKTQTYLKKVGFDVLAQNHDQRIADQILTFNPDIVVVCGKQKFHSLTVGTKLKEISGLRAKVILVLPNGERPNPMELTKARVDVLIEAPVSAERLIQVLAKLTNLDPAGYLEKFKKAKLTDPTLDEAPPRAAQGQDAADSVMVRGAAPKKEKIQIHDPSRAEKYRQFAEQLPIDKSQTSHTRQAIKNRQAELKKGWDFDLLEEIDQLKRQFTRALFKKN